MEAYLIEKGLGSTIKETPRATRASTTDADIEANNSIKACALIRLSLEDGPLIQTKGLQTALELWKKLKELYEPKGFSNEFQLYRELFTINLANFTDIEAYLNKAKRL